MNTLLQILTTEIASYLSTKLPQLHSEWWDSLVFDKLSFQQQRLIEEKKVKTLSHLDLAALLRVFDKNWFELSREYNLSWTGLTWIKELQTVRNKWAHLSSQEPMNKELYRDADTLSLLLDMIDASQSSLEETENYKNNILSKMTQVETVVTPVIKVSKDIENIIEIFKVGDIAALRSDKSILLPIIEVISSGEEVRYKTFNNGVMNTYYESQLIEIDSSHEDFEILMAQETKSLITSLNLMLPSTSSLFSMKSGKVDFIPYQYRPVLKMIQAEQPRLLIADEVGVGKTIETGLIIKELGSRMDLNSILVICPKALVAEKKWYTEMKRFDEEFTSLDGNTLRHCIKETHLDGEWPEKYEKAIVPFSLFDSNLIDGKEKRSKKELGLLSLDPAPKFDLVIVDEAHHIRNSDTYLHQGVRYFCENAQAVILLTATPVQLGSDDLFTLLNVLRPDLVIDKASYEQMAEPNPYINAAVLACRSASDEWQGIAREQLTKAIETSWGNMFIRENPSFQKIYDLLLTDDINDESRVSLTHEIESLYTFSSIINRTRRRDIGEFTSRKAETLLIDFTPDQASIHIKLLSIIEKILLFSHGEKNLKFMMTTVRRQAASCIYGLAPLLNDWLIGKVEQLELLELADNEDNYNLEFLDNVREDIKLLVKETESLDPYDPKVESFIKVVNDKNSLENNKVLLFSTFRHTLSYLSSYMEKTSLRFGLIHGSVSDEDRADLRWRFSLPKEDNNAIDVLLSSEVGCEGLDFQFCDLLINYDLPWNPMRIEQRIGRIDRYGQKSSTVAIVNIITAGTVDADIYERCLLRIGVFERAVGGNEEILGSIGTEIHNIADNFNLSEEERNSRLQQLSDNSIRIIREETELENQQAGLFGLDIPKQSWEEDIKAAEAQWLSSDNIDSLVSSYLIKRLETEHKLIKGQNGPKTLRLSSEARLKLLQDYKLLNRSSDLQYKQWGKWLKGSEQTIQVSFSHEDTINFPNVTHLSVLHPLVKQAAEFFKIDKMGHTTLNVNTDLIEEGTYKFVLYSWSIKGIKKDQQLVVVSKNKQIEEHLMNVLEYSSDSEVSEDYTQENYEELDVLHHSKWDNARANHIEDNQQLLSYRAQSLTASYNANCKVIADRLLTETSEKIISMKNNQLKRLELDYTYRMNEIKSASESADILTSPILFGTISVRNS